MQTVDNRSQQIQQQRLDTKIKKQTADSEKAEVKTPTLNRPATAQYLSIVSHEQDEVGDVLARSYNRLNQSLTQTAAAPEQQTIDEQAEKMGTYAKLAVKVISRDPNLQEQVAQDLSSGKKLVRSRNAADTLHEALSNLPRPLKEGTTTGKHLAKFIVENLVNLTDTKNMGAGLERDLAVRQISVPKQQPNLRTQQATSKVLAASIAYVQSNQPEVLATLESDTPETVKPGTTTAQVMTRYLRQALNEFPEDSTYLDIFKQNRGHQKAEGYADKMSEEIAQRIHNLISKAANTAKSGNLIQLSPEEAARFDQIQREAAGQGLNQAQANATNAAHTASANATVAQGTQGAPMAQGASANAANAALAAEAEADAPSAQGDKSMRTLSLSELSARAAKLQQQFRQERQRLANDGKLPDPAPLPAKSFDNVKTARDILKGTLSPENFALTERQQQVKEQLTQQQNNLNTSLLTSKLNAETAAAQEQSANAASKLVQTLSSGNQNASASASTQAQASQASQASQGGQAALDKATVAQGQGQVQSQAAADKENASGATAMANEAKAQLKNLLGEGFGGASKPQAAMPSVASGTQTLARSSSFDQGTLKAPAASFQMEFNAIQNNVYGDIDIMPGMTIPVSHFGQLSHDKLQPNKQALESLKVQARLLEESLKQQAQNILDQDGLDADNKTNLATLKDSAPNMSDLEQALKASHSSNPANSASTAQTKAQAQANAAASGSGQADSANAASAATSAGNRAGAAESMATPLKLQQFLQQAANAIQQQASSSGEPLSLEQTQLQQFLKQAQEVLQKLAPNLGEDITSSITGKPNTSAPANTGNTTLTSAQSQAQAQSQPQAQAQTQPQGQTQPLNQAEPQDKPALNTPTNTAGSNGQTAQTGTGAGIGAGANASAQAGAQTGTQANAQTNANADANAANANTSSQIQAQLKDLQSALDQPVKSQGNMQTPSQAQLQKVLTQAQNELESANRAPGQESQAAKQSSTVSNQNSSSTPSRAPQPTTGAMSQAGVDFSQAKPNAGANANASAGIGAGNNASAMTQELQGGRPSWIMAPANAINELSNKEQLQAALNKTLDNLQKQVQSQGGQIFNAQNLLQDELSSTLATLNRTKVTPEQLQAQLSSLQNALSKQPQVQGHLQNPVQAELQTITSQAQQELSARQNLQEAALQAQMQAQAQSQAQVQAQSQAGNGPTLAAGLASAAESNLASGSVLTQPQGQGTTATSTQPNATQTNAGQQSAQQNAAQAQNTTHASNATTNQAASGSGVTTNAQNSATNPPANTGSNANTAAGGTNATGNAISGNTGAGGAQTSNATNATNATNASDAANANTQAGSATGNAGTSVAGGTSEAGNNADAGKAGEDLKAQGESKPQGLSKELSSALKDALNQTLNNLKQQQKSQDGQLFPSQSALHKESWATLALLPQAASDPKRLAGQLTNLQNALEAQTQAQGKFQTPVQSKLQQVITQAQQELTKAAEAAEAAKAAAQQAQAQQTQAQAGTQSGAGNAMGASGEVALSQDSQSGLKQALTQTLSNLQQQIKAQSGLVFPNQSALQDAAQKALDLMGQTKLDPQALSTQLQNLQTALTNQTQAQGNLQTPSQSQLQQALTQAQQELAKSQPQAQTQGQAQTATSQGAGAIAGMGVAGSAEVGTETSAGAGTGTSQAHPLAGVLPSADNLKLALEQAVTNLQQQVKVQGGQIFPTQTALQQESQGTLALLQQMQGSSTPGAQASALTSQLASLQEALTKQTQAQGNLQTPSQAQLQQVLIQAQKELAAYTPSRQDLASALGTTGTPGSSGDPSAPSTTAGNATTAAGNTAMGNAGTGNAGNAAVSGAQGVQGTLGAGTGSNAGTGVNSTGANGAAENAGVTGTLPAVGSVIDTQRLQQALEQTQQNIVQQVKAQAGQAAPQQLQLLESLENVKTGLAQKVALPELNTLLNQAQGALLEQTKLQGNLQTPAQAHLQQVLNQDLTALRQAYAQAQTQGQTQTQTPGQIPGQAPGQGQTLVQGQVQGQATGPGTIPDSSQGVAGSSQGMPSTGTGTGAGTTSGATPGVGTSTIPGTGTLPQAGQGANSTAQGLTHGQVGQFIQAGQAYGQAGQGQGLAQGQGQVQGASGQAGTSAGDLGTLGLLNSIKADPSIGRLIEFNNSLALAQNALKVLQEAPTLPQKQAAFDQIQQSLTLAHTRITSPEVNTLKNLQQLQQLVGFSELSVINIARANTPELTAQAMQQLNLCLSQAQREAQAQLAAKGVLAQLQQMHAAHSQTAPAHGQVTGQPNAQANGLPNAQSNAQAQVNAQATGSQGAPMPGQAATAQQQAANAVQSSANGAPMAQQAVLTQGSSGANTASTAQTLPGSANAQAGIGAGVGAETGAANVQPGMAQAQPGSVLSDVDSGLPTEEAELAAKFNQFKHQGAVGNEANAPQVANAHITGSANLGTVLRTDYSNPQQAAAAAAAHGAQRAQATPGTITALAHQAGELTPQQAVSQGLSSQGLAWLERAAQNVGMSAEQFRQTLAQAQANAEQLRTQTPTQPSGDKANNSGVLNYRYADIFYKMHAPITNEANANANTNANANAGTGVGAGTGAGIGTGAGLGTGVSAGTGASTGAEVAIPQALAERAAYAKAEGANGASATATANANAKDSAGLNQAIVNFGKAEAETPEEVARENSVFATRTSLGAAQERLEAAQAQRESVGSTERVQQQHAEVIASKESNLEQYQARQDVQAQQQQQVVQKQEQAEAALKQERAAQVVQQQQQQAAAQSSTKLGINADPDLVDQQFARLYQQQRADQQQYAQQQQANVAQQIRAGGSSITMPHSQVLAQGALNGDLQQLMQNQALGAHGNTGASQATAEAQAQALAQGTQTIGRTAVVADDSFTPNRPATVGNTNVEARNPITAGQNTIASGQAQGQGQISGQALGQAPGTATATTAGSATLAGLGTGATASQTGQAGQVAVAGQTMSGQAALGAGNLGAKLGTAGTVSAATGVNAATGVGAMGAAGATGTAGAPGTNAAGAAGTGAAGAAGAAGLVPTGDGRAALSVASLNNSMPFGATIPNSSTSLTIHLDDLNPIVQNMGSTVPSAEEALNTQALSGVAADTDFTPDDDFNKLLQQNMGAEKGVNGVAGVAGAAAITSGQNEPIPEESVAPSVSAPREGGFLHRLASLFSGKTHDELGEEISAKSETEKNLSTTSPEMLKALHEQTLQSQLKQSSLDQLMQRLQTSVADQNLPPHIREQAHKLMQALENPVADLHSVSSWLNFVTGPMSPSSSQALAMHQWAFMLLCIRFEQIGKNVEKFLKKRMSGEDIAELEPRIEAAHHESGMFNDLVDDAPDKAQSLLEDAMSQVNRLQQQMEGLPQGQLLPRYIPLPPFYRGGKEGSLHAQQHTDEDGGKSWHLNFNLDLEKLGPMQVKVKLRFPDIQMSFVTGNLEALQAVQAHMPELNARLKEIGLTSKGSSARLGRLSAPNLSSPSRDNGPRNTYGDNAFNTKA